MFRNPVESTPSTVPIYKDLDHSNISMHTRKPSVLQRQIFEERYQFPRLLILLLPTQEIASSSHFLFSKLCWSMSVVKDLHFVR